MTHNKFLNGPAFHTNLSCPTSSVTMVCMTKPLAPAPGPEGVYRALLSTQWLAAGRDSCKQQR